MQYHAKSIKQPDQIDVARLAGVSLGSVSTAINRPDLVSEKMRLRVQAAIDELGYVPNRSASTLRRGGANRVLGLAIPEIANPFYAAIVDAVVDAADRHSYAVSLCVSHQDADRERRHFTLLAQQRAAGALVVPISPTGEWLSQLRAVGTRIILVDRAADTELGCSVSVDDVAGGRMAVAHLLESAGEGITLVNGPREIPQCQQRWEGAVAAIRDAGLPERALVEITVDAMTIPAGIAVADQIVTANLPRRIFGINDQLATGVMEGFTRRDMSVPQDARVIGYGDLGLDNGYRLSTVGQPKHELGALAVELLLEELDAGSAHAHSATIFQPYLIARESSRA